MSECLSLSSFCCHLWFLWIIILSRETMLIEVLVSIDNYREESFRDVFVQRNLPKPQGTKWNRVLFCTITEIVRKSINLRLDINLWKYILQTVFFSHLFYDLESNKLTFVSLLVKPKLVYKLQSMPKNSFNKSAQ